MNIELTRRQFMKTTAIAGAGMALPLSFWKGNAYAFYQTSPALQKWQTTLRGIGVDQIPVVNLDAFSAPETGVAHATIALKEFTDTLHPKLGPTKLWGFHPVNPLFAGAQKHLGGIIVVKKGTPLQITFKNQLPAKNIIPVDATIPGANQAQNRTAIHLHGGLIPWISDGGPFDWWAPNGTHGLSFLNNQVLNPGALAGDAEYFYPNNQSARLLWYHDHAFGITRINAYAGIASAYIIRDDFERNMIVNPTNLLAPIDPDTPPPPDPTGIPDYIENGGYELPIVFQDKIFVGTNISTLDPTWVQKGLPSTAGSLWYPHVYEKNRWRLLGAGRNLPNPSVIAEMFGDTMLVNGTVHPKVAVEPRRYRLRILNACNARFLNLQLYVEDTNGNSITYDGAGNPTNTKGPDWFVLGMEGGFLKNPVTVPSNIPFGVPATLREPYAGSLITGCAERFDVIVDFSNFGGQNIIMYNDSPAPYPGGDPRNDYLGNNGFGPDTRQLMRFEVSGTPVNEPALAITEATDLTAGIDPFLANVAPFVSTLNPGGAYTLNTAVARTRQLTLNEVFDAYGRLAQNLGTNAPTGPGKFNLPYLAATTEDPTHGAVEIWEIYNLTGDTHPIHIHLVNFQILNRQAFDVTTYNGTATFLALPYGPDKTELGWKETAKMNPGEVIRLIMKFDLPAVPFAVPASPRTGGHEYVWHCHILEHEEHDMMRPLVVTPNPPPT